MAKMPAPFRDSGHANFGASAGARNAVAFANPLTPGGMNSKGVHSPTIIWALAFVVVAFIAYKTVLKGKI